MNQRAWHSETLEDVVGYWQTDPRRGLHRGAATERLERVGPNVLARGAATSPLAILAEQFHDFMVLVLIAATGVSFWLGEISDAITIMAIVVMNAVLGFLQEYRAERSLQALRQLTAPRALVVRDGREVEIPSEQVVPGDVVVLDSGDRVPADARLLECVNLECDEAALTGESHGVPKTAAVVVQAEKVVADRPNMVFAGTMVTRGRGRAVVVATGMQTEMGSIAALIQEADTGATPLQKRLDQLGKYLVLACLGVSAVVTVSGVLRGEPLFTMFLTGVSLAVAAIPEGLPAVVTIALALGVERMIKRNVVVRRLHAVETLGCAQVICSDKTGTLTQNQMRVRSLLAGGRSYDRLQAGGFSHKGETVATEADIDLKRVLLIGALCNNESVHLDSDSASTRAGDPTEKALLMAAMEADVDLARWDTLFPRKSEIPFDSDRRRMSVTVEAEAAPKTLFPTVSSPEAGDTLLLKGAPDTVLERCSHIIEGSRVRALTTQDVDAIMETNGRFAARAERVLALAYRRPTAGQDPEQGLVFAGLAGMIDPPRPEVGPALEKCHRAGMMVAMITGDQPRTAQAIAGELGLLRGNGTQVVTGPDLDAMADDELDRRLATATVFARVSPHHKLRLVRRFRRLGRVVAMTGDGVNDAPAVKEADIGVAMGRSGTDVTREASDMVLTDDNFASIVAAVEEGRAIYNNIRKFIRYLLACNTGEVLVMFLASVLRLPLPLIPIHILFVNLVTDGLPAIALGLDPNLDDVMSRPPRATNESIFARGLTRRILVRGLLIGVSSLAVFAGSLLLGGDLVRARTMALATLVLSQLFHVFDCRSERRSIFELGFFTNMPLVWAVTSSVMALAAALYIPALQSIFRTAPLSPGDWLLVFGVAALGGILIALRRIYARTVAPHFVVFTANREA